MPYRRGYKKRSGKSYGKNYVKRSGNSNRGMGYVRFRKKALGAKYKSTRALAYKGWQMAIRQEKKHTTINVASTSIDDDGIINSPYGTGVATGVGTDERTGKQTRFQGFKITMMVEGDIDRAGAHRVRAIFGLWDGQSLPGLGNILSQTALNSTYSPYSTGNAGKYKVLYDRIFVLSPNQGSPNYVYGVQKYLAFNGVLQSFAQDTKTFPETNQSFIIFVSDVDAGELTFPHVRYHVRAYWTDN